MTAITGQGEEHWKNKYYNQLDKLEKKEREWSGLEYVLKKAVGRLSLAAEGHNGAIDQYIRDIRALIKNDIDCFRLESILDELSKLLAQAEQKQAVPDQQIVAALQTLLASLELPKACDKARQKLLKRLTNASDKDKDACISDLVAVFNQALVLQKPTSEKKSGFLQRIIGAQDKKNTSQKDSREVEIYRSCVISLLDEFDNKTLPDDSISTLRAAAKDAVASNQLTSLVADLARTVGNDVAKVTAHDAGIEPSIQELLIRLLEQLVVPIDFHKQVENMKTRLEKYTQLADWKLLLKDVVALINSIRIDMQNEKHEFESFLQQITGRLKDMDNFLQNESVSIDVAEKEGRAFDMQVNSHVKNIRNDLQQASDLESLKGFVERRLENISVHIKEHRDLEKKRYTDAKKDVFDMQNQMMSLEKESAGLRDIIVEKNRQAMFDALTEIPNRLAYEKKAQEEIARWKRFSNPLSLVIWDIDFFKKVNDTYGHKAGDKVLKTIAQLLHKRIRETDFLARFGGEEFVMFLPGTKEEETLRLVNDLRKRIETCGFHYQGETVNITISCGISSFRQGDTLETVFGRADTALYKAKKNGRNQCVVASCRSD
jgi:diguanylate cyclase